MTSKCETKCPCDCIYADVSTIRVILHRVQSLPDLPPEVSTAAATAASDAASLQTDVHKCDVPTGIVDALKLSADLVALESIVRQQQQTRDDVVSLVVHCESLASKAYACLICKNYQTASMIDEIRTVLRDAEASASGDLLTALKSAEDAAADLLIKMTGPTGDFVAAVEAFVVQLHALEAPAASAPDVIVAVLDLEVMAARLRDCVRFDDFSTVAIAKIRARLFKADRLASAPEHVDLRVQIKMAEASADIVRDKLESSAPRDEAMKAVRHLLLDIVKSRVTADEVHAVEIRDSLAKSECDTEWLLKRLKCDSALFVSLCDSLMQKFIAVEPLIPTTIPPPPTVVALLHAVLESEQLVDRLRCQIKKCLKDEWHLIWAEQTVADLRVHIDASLQLADQLQDIAIKTLILESQPLALELSDKLERLEDHVDDHLFDIRTHLRDAEIVVTAPASAQLKTKLLILQSHLADIHIMIDAKQYGLALPAIAQLIVDTKAVEYLAEQFQEFDAKAMIVQAEIEEAALQTAVQKRSSS